MKELFIKGSDSLPVIFFNISAIQYVETTRMLRPFGLTVEQTGLLIELYEKDGISQKSLSEQALKDQANTTRMLKRLIDKGLIERRNSPADKRLNLVYLTDKGRKLVETIEPRMKETEQDFIKLFPPGEYAVFKKQAKEYLAKMVDKIGYYKWK